MNSHNTDSDSAEETCSNITVERQTDVESICIQDINTKKEPYTIFSTQQQIILVIITAFTAMISPLTANIYLPALNQIEEVQNRIFKKKSEIHKLHRVCKLIPSK